MSMNQEKDMDKKSLPFFGIGKVIPFMKKYRAIIIAMVTCGLMSSGVDILIPQFQRYALNHFIGEKTLDTLPIFLLVNLFPTGQCGTFSNWKNISEEQATENS